MTDREKIREILMLHDDIEECIDEIFALPTASVLEEQNELRALRKNYASQVAYTTKLEGKIREMEEATATVTKEELINMLQKLERAVRDYADIGGKQFNQDEEEFWRMCDVNDEAEKFLSTITRKQKG